MNVFEQAMELRRCTRCRVEKPLDQFYHGVDRRHIECSNDARERRIAMDRPLHLLRQRDRGLRRIYGISIDDYEAMLAQQGGGCAICGSTDPGRGGRQVSFSVDHDHLTGRVRGLLCHLCNTGIGAFNDEPDRLRQAALYLEGISDG